MSISPKQQKNWYSTTSTPGAAMSARKEAISRYRSPHTIADEIYRIISWGVQPLLLVFCGALSFSSYQAFFAHNFSPLFATIGAVILSAVIELGKIKIGGYVFQVPFLSGVQVLRSSFPAFAVWAGALLLTLVTFTMSVINSTKGAAMLAQKAGFEKHDMVFTPNTADIDAQIKDADNRITSAKDVKWKGTVTYQAQQAIKSDSRTIADLQKQRKEAIQQQRADFERKRAQLDTNTTNGADILMAAGGWVEALQIIALFLLAACMATIDRQIETEKQASPTKANISGPNDPLQEFSRNGHGAHNRSQIGFRWEGYGEHQPTPPQGVTHQPRGVTHQYDPASDDVLRLARKDFGSWAANIGSKKHDSGNAHAHVTRILDALRTTMQTTNFQPSGKMAGETYMYFAQKLNEIEGRGWPYDFKDELLRELWAFVGQQETALT